MKEIKSVELMKQIIQEEELVILYLSQDDCSICSVDYPIIDKISNVRGIEAYNINVLEVPNARGEFSIFSVPVILIYLHGKEYLRQARFLDFSEIEYRLDQIAETM